MDVICQDNNVADLRMIYCIVAKSGPDALAKNLLTARRRICACVSNKKLNDECRCRKNNISLAVSWASFILTCISGVECRLANSKSARQN